MFVKEKHIKYWLRCFTTPLPHQYQANDASLLSLTFFTLSALDLLGALQTHTKSDERQSCVEAIYACQHPDGGFRGFRGTALGPEKRNNANKVWDPANLPACYFALGSLLVLGDDLARVDKAGCLSLLCRLQRADGSFGEYLGHDNTSIMGGMDSRYGYCAMAVRWILRTNDASLQGKSVFGTPDVDVESLVDCIRCSETYDGGLSEEPSHEAHAGFTYCAVAALSLLDRLPRDGERCGLRNPTGVAEWLLARLTTQIEEFDQSESEAGEDDDYGEPTVKPDGQKLQESLLTTSLQPRQSNPEPSFQKLRSIPLAQSHPPSTSSPPPPTTTPSHTNLTPLLPTHLLPNQAAGFSGRANKPADTCYAFWAGASLQLLSSPTTLPFEQVLDTHALRRYLLSHTQHAIAGGFGKFPGDPPDVYHSYMGLAALSIIDKDSTTERGGSPVKRLDPGLCMSVTAREWCESLAWRRNLA